MDILKEALGMYVNLVVLLGTGAGVTWWATRRLEERIQKEVQGMDRLQSIEMRMLNIENRVSGIEEKMATKEDLNKMVADMTATMVAKDDLNKMVANMTATMATKEDLSKMVAKDDLNKMVANMATKDDLAKLLDAINNRNGQGGPG
ncbi:hypothetical protein [Thioalkalivibrio sp. HK1]|uniref:hypothetical protein n=1 Tax=Thioalkalivibrio sp. HK1 TaxID=1469245 RepID=UPI0012DF47C0|nr:hypothetical protein [Thioalkalivibrio sp. HK1]